ncbi:MAG: metallophosphoesterase [Prevotellaceae bacterium]|nr:metallophosphoesterase [Prevotellaceae bacterium]
MVNNTNISRLLLAATVAMAGLYALSSCDKVSATGILVGGTGVDDRVEMSYLYYKNELSSGVTSIVDGDYTFLVGADSHIAEDTCRLAEMFQISLENEDLFCAHLGDLADTKPEYYILTRQCVAGAKRRFVEKYYDYEDEFKDYVKDKETGDVSSYDDVVFPFFPVVGNHDITHNGWALFQSIFGSSFYEFDVFVDGTEVYDHFIFLDSANGTFGRKQLDYIEEGLMDADEETVHLRNTFVFTHTNFFRPSRTQFASTLPREEMYYMLNKFEQWQCTAVFCGHVHAWDQRRFGTVEYFTLDSMGERNSPAAGEYLVRVTCKKNGEVKYEKVRMNYEAK